MALNNCPLCNDELSLLLEDYVVCGDCDNEITIEYWVCRGCGYTCRVNNGRLMDADVLDNQEIIDVFNSVFEAVENEGPSNILDCLTPCVRCNSPAAYESSPGNYECPDCAFSWEIFNYK